MLRQLAAAAFFSPPPGPPSVPTLLLASAWDRLVSPICSQQLAVRWSLPIRLHPNAGHDLPLDDPDWVIRQIVRWWRDRSGAASQN
jgi:pimeloyl-ACP methyl ester carboxylesterase